MQALGSWLASHALHELEHWQMNRSTLKQDHRRFETNDHPQSPTIAIHAERARKINPLARNLGNFKQVETA